MPQKVSNMLPKFINMSQKVDDIAHLMKFGNDALLAATEIDNKID